MDTPHKRFRSHGYELRVLIPSRVAGSIIGKGGSNITRLRAESKGVTISVPDCPGPERILTISSDDQDLTFGVLHQVVPLIEDGKSDGSSVELRLLYHHTEVGGIIGKGGARIKELRATTSTQIKVYGDCCPGSTDRVVAISGAVDMVLNAVREISILVLENPIKGPVDPYDPHNFDETFAAHYGGYGEMRGGGEGGGRGYGGGGGGRSYGPSRGYGGMQDSERRGGYGGGGGGGRGRGGGGGYRGDGDGGGRSRGNYGDDDYGGGRAAPRHRGNDGEDDYAGEDTTTQVTIPKEFAGAIIGKGGTRIRKIRADSGAKITIEEALPGSQDRVITIVGGSEQIRMAQYLLQQSVKDHGERN